MLLLLSVYMYVALDSIDGYVAILEAFHKYFACGNNKTCSVCLSTVHRITQKVVDKFLTKFSSSTSHKFCDGVRYLANKKKTFNFDANLDHGICSRSISITG